MKKLVLLLFLIQSQIVSSQTVVNQDSLIFYFQQIINEYRLVNGLNPMVVDVRFKPFTDTWSKYMATNKYVGHGTGDNSLTVRVENFKKTNTSYTSKNINWFENCTDMATPQKNMVVHINCPKPELTPFVEKSYSGEITQEELALYVFLSWKVSPGHNATMLSKTTTRFYLSCYRLGDRTYVSYLSSDQ